MKHIIKPLDAEKELEAIMQIWLESNKQAHDFVPASYWESNFEEVKQVLPEADVQVCWVGNTPAGFIGIVDGYIAGIFVSAEYRSAGIGKELLAYAKEHYDTLTLAVYEKNQRAVNFYQKNGFSTETESLVEEQNETEYHMIWNR